MLTSIHHDSCTVCQMYAHHQHQFWLVHSSWWVTATSQQHNELNVTTATWPYSRAEIRKSIPIKYVLCNAVVLGHVDCSSHSASICHHICKLGWIRNPNDKFKYSNTHNNTTLVGEWELHLFLDSVFLLQHPFCVSASHCFFPPKVLLPMRKHIAV